MDENRALRIQVVNIKKGENKFLSQKRFGGPPVVTLRTPIGVPDPLLKTPDVEHSEAKILRDLQLRKAGILVLSALWKSWSSSASTQSETIDPAGLRPIIHAALPCEPISEADSFLMSNRSLLYISAAKSPPDECIGT